MILPETPVKLVLLMISTNFLTVCSECRFWMKDLVSLSLTSCCRARAYSHTASYLTMKTICSV